MAEDLACRYLQQRGLHLLKRNYRCRWGEIDLIMLDQGDIVYVEVRYRRSARFGGALASINANKRRRLIATAMHHQQHHPQAARQTSRFDVIAISGPETQPNIQWVQDAFRVD